MEDCSCPGCGKALVAKIGQRIKEPHFAHQKERIEELDKAPRCDLRSLSSRLGGYFLRARLKRNLALGRSVTMAWYCVKCGRLHRVNLLEGVTALDSDGLEGEARLIGLFGPAASGQRDTLLGIVEVGFQRGDPISSEVAAMAKSRQVPVWLVTTSSQEAAARLADDAAGDVESSREFQVPCLYRPPPSPYAPTLPTSPPEPPKRLGPPRPKVEPTTFALPTVRENFASCLRCRRTLARRYLLLHTFPDNSTIYPGYRVGLLLYQTSEWFGVGWEYMSEAERVTAYASGAIPDPAGNPSLYSNLGYTAARARRGTLGSFSCWCPHCKEIIDTLD